MTKNDHALELLNSGRPLAAIPILRELAWREPSYKAYMNLSSALRYAGQFDDAIAYLSRAVSIDPIAPNAWLTLANISTDVGDWYHALKYYEGAFSRTEKTGDIYSQRQAALGYAQALLREHRYQDAWPLWEFGRFQYSYSALPGTKRWLGEPTSSLLVMCEGGFGDAMLFARWLPFTKTRAKHVKLMIWDCMTTFRDWAALGIDEVLPISEEIEAGGIEYTTSWMSIPGIAGMRSVADIPRDEGFGGVHLFSPKRIGFCWRAEENRIIRKFRSLSLTDAEALATRLAAHGEVISLCPRHLHLHEQAPEEWPSNITQDEGLLNGWDVTAATIRSCRFIVTVDTAVAHLAGLCGVPTLLLLPCANDWKWGTLQNQAIDPWYGSHVRYYRNSDPLKWDVEDIALAVGEECITH